MNSDPFPNPGGWWPPNFQQDLCQKCQFLQQTVMTTASETFGSVEGFDTILHRKPLKDIVQYLFCDMQLPYGCWLNPRDAVKQLGSFCNLASECRDLCGGLPLSSERNYNLQEVHLLWSAIGILNKDPVENKRRSDDQWRFVTAPLSFEMTQLLNSQKKLLRNFL